MDWTTGRLYLRRNANFKEKLAAFSMKTTDSKDLVKVNQILPIMVNHQYSVPTIYQRVSRTSE